MARKSKYALYETGRSVDFSTPSSCEFPSVTTIDCRDKSAQLMAWAVNTMADYLKGEYQKLDEVFSNEDEIDPELFYYNIVDHAKKHYRDLATEAAGIGSEVHDAIEQFVKHGEIKEEFSCPEAQNSFNAFLEWSDENVEYYIESERVVFSEQHGYAGCLDAIAQMKVNKLFPKGGKFLVDFKTSKAIYDSMVMQLAAYCGARSEMYGTYKYRNTDGEILVEEYEKIDIDGAGIIRIDKETGLPEWKNFTDKLDRQYDAFILLVRFFYVEKYRQLKNNPWVISNF